MRVVDVPVSRWAWPTLLAWMLVTCPFARALEECSTAAHEIVTVTAVTALPTPLGQFFAPRLDSLQQSATCTPEADSSAKGGVDSADRHYVMLDVVPGRDVRRFPQQRAEAMRLFKRRGVRNGGELPWVILERYAGLARAFASGGDDAVVAETGALLGFVADAALPFNTTRDRDGKLAGALRWSSSEAGAATDAHRTLRHRSHDRLLERFRARFDFEVRVFPGRLEHVADPRQAVFDAMFDAHDALDPLVKIDAQVLADLNIHDTATFLTSADAYYEGLADRAASILEARLEAGGLLGANLITAAWVEAGRPTALSARGAPAQVQRRTSLDEILAKYPYVGSRNSMTFHKATCPHARRIKPENLVGFESIEEATRAGRTPCKSCKPTAP